MRKDSLSCSLASPIAVNQALMICGVFWLHRRAMWHFATIKSKWVSSLNTGLCLAHLVLFELGLKIVLFPEWTSHAEFFFFNYPQSYHRCWNELFFPYSLSNDLPRWRDSCKVLWVRNFQVNSLICKLFLYIDIDIDISHSCYFWNYILSKYFKIQKDPNAGRCYLE